MTVWVIIPVKASAAAKGRLAQALTADERNHLSQAMLRRAVKASCAAVGGERVLLVGQSPIDLPHGVEVLGEPEGGLNAALAHARAEVSRRGATRVISLAADLPLVAREDVLALANLPDAQATIAPDRHGTGTNALSLPLPDALGFSYAYGLGSCELHLAEARRLGLAMTRTERPGLARDVDEPADLVDARDLLIRQQG
ncbi:2-phospho-L-lactate guanylyltransferase [Novosphingobium sp. TH158]|uniref:2-phospho-L-lactate guanylyltransferase n=1 Tax=Novosphingobium sp. TH158 TaxID=2067455 RepID=UPI000C7BC116|nr:2-phospho-L-lactate guanylyltransferase [Novosphingobium sp. TH158]PLK26200.1 2-phospho-L-lactate guanylyltransferase [Novosphingobium sp. TH158]